MQQRGILFLVIALVVILAPLEALAQTTLDSEDAAALFVRGNELFDAGNFSEAYMFYEKSFRLKPSYDSAANAGMCAHKLGRYPDAARLLRYGLDHIPNSLEPEKRAAAEQRLNQLFADATSRVGTLTVRLSPQGAELAVDGEHAGVAPLDSALYLSPGQHTLLAHLSGHRDVERSVAVAAGQSQTLDLVVLPAETNGAGPSIPVVVIGAVVGVGLVATGIGLLVAAAGEASDREDLSASLSGTNPCGEGSPYPSECDEVRSLSGTEKTFRGIGIAGIAVGGAALVATLLYGVWPRGEGDTAITPAFGPTFAGLSFATSF